MATLVNNQNNDQKQGQQNTPGQIAQPTAPSGPAFAGQQSGTSNTPASSGRFVNTQQFLNANKNAGQQIGGAIQSGITSQLDKEKGAVGKEAENVRSGIQAAQGNVSTGAGYLGNFGGDASKYNPSQPVQKLDTEGMVAMANDPTKLKQVTDYRTGAIAQQDTTNLNNLNQIYAYRAAAANAALQQRQQQLQGEVNRFGLLGEFVGQKNNYGQGAQRLDQTFLQRDKSGALNNLQQNLAQQKAGDFNKMLTDADVYRGQATDVTGQARDLAKDIGVQTGKNETGYINDLSGQVAGVNDARHAEQQKYRDAVDIMRGTKQGQVADNVWSDLGLTDNMNVYDLFDKNNSAGVTKAEDIANFGADASNYHDIATKKNVDQYAALAKLAGLDNSKLNAAGNLSAAAKARDVSDAGNILNRIMGRYTGIMDQADQDTGLNSHWATYGKQSYGNGGETSVFRGASDYGGLKSILQNAGYSVPNNPKESPKNYFSPVEDPTLTAQQRFGKDLVNTVSGHPDASSLLNLSTYGTTGLESDIGTGLSKAFGLGEGAGNAEGAALTQAKENLQRMISDWAQGHGLNNRLTRSGVRDAKDIGNRVSTMNNGGAV